VLGSLLSAGMTAKQSVVFRLSDVSAYGTK
jgi:hypothetical protein